MQVDEAPKDAAAPPSPLTVALLGLLLYYMWYLLSFLFFNLACFLCTASLFVNEIRVKHWIYCNLPKFQT